MREQKTRAYRRMTEADRYKIEALHNAKVPVWKIAEELGFSKVTIYAELKRGAYQHRNTDWTETTKYSAYKAQRDADYNATAKGAQLKIGNDHAFAKFVETMILAGYSPEALLGFIKDNNWSIFNKCTSNSNTLFLTTRKQYTSFTNFGIKTFIKS